MIRYKWAEAPLDCVSLGMHYLTFALGYTGVGDGGGGGGGIHREGWHAPHAIGIVGASALDAKPAAIAPVSAPGISTVPELCAIGCNAPTGKRDDVVDTGLAVVGDNAGAVPVFQRISVDAAADWTTGKDLLRRE